MDSKTWTDLNSLYFVDMQIWAVIDADAEEFPYVEYMYMAYNQASHYPLKCLISAVYDTIFAAYPIQACWNNLH